MQTGMFSGNRKRAYIISKCFRAYSLIGFQCWRKMLQKFSYSVFSPHYSLPMLLCLLPFLTSACLTTRTAKAPAFRGLTAKEADRLESQNESAWQKPRSAKPEKDDSPENLAEMAAIFLQNGDYERSVHNYSKILSQNPERYDIRYKLAISLLLAGNLEESKKELAEVLLHKMDMVEAHDALGVVYLQENKFTEAQQEFRSALALNPRRYQSHYLLGETFLRQQQFSQAIPEFKAALEAVPGSARVMAALGWAYFKQKDSDQGLQWLKKAKAIDSNNSRINYRLGMILAAQKKYPEALAAFRQAGDEAQAFNNIGVHYYLDHRYDEAARCFQKALELRPTFYEEAKGNLDKALSKLQEDNLSSADLPERQLKEISLSKNTKLMP
jgi:tetratricopeptide (TPR) repeat protein